MTRPFDKHLDSDELDGLVSLHPASVSDSGGLSEHTLREAQRHVESCQDCSRKVQMHKSVQSEILRVGVTINVPPGRDCVDETEWFSVAAGLLLEAKTRDLMKHAAQCGHCGLLLKNAAETLADEVTPSEETLLASLSSARPEWQRDMASTILGKVQDREKLTWWRGIFTWPLPAYAFASIVAVALVAGIGVRALRSPSAEQLLAEAYTEQRVLDVRIPGARYSPVRVVRGKERSRLNRPPELLEAEALIARQLTIHPNDPRWLQAKGRSDLLDGNYSSAIETLESARGAEPDSSSLLADLGNAYLQRGDTEGRAADYATAVDCYGRALSRSRNDPLVLFNRAIALERMFLLEPAVEDWREYLKDDPNGEWSAEAQQRLDATLEKLKARERSSSQPLLSPSEIGRRVAARDPSIETAVDERIEDYLQATTREWLTRAFADTRARPRQDLRDTLVLVASLQKVKHQDSWLSDMLEASSSLSALGALSDATKASTSGDYATALTQARFAAAAFHADANLAGELRAHLEEIYALQLSNQGRQCADSARRLAALPAVTRYMWISVQLQLEEGVCLSLVGELGRAQRLVSKAEKMATEAGYGGLYLRAAGFMADFDADNGELARGWKRALEGLAKFWSGNYPAMRGYNLYASMDQLSDAADLWHLQVAVWQQAIYMISCDPDTLLRAMAYSRLGTAAFMSDMLPVSQSAFEAASRLLAASPRTEASRNKEIDVAIWLARVEARKAQATGAIARLNALRPEISHLSSRYVTMDYYQAMAELQARAGHLDESERAMRSAIAISEEVLRSMNSETNRLLWSRKTGIAYRMLVELKLKQQDITGALELWEWYRAAPRRVPSSSSGGAAPFELSPTALDKGPDLPSLTGVTRSESELTTQTVVSYAVLPGGLAIWVYDNRGIQGKWIPIAPEELRRRLDRFTRLCADSRSDITILRQEASRLYSILISGVADWLPPHRRLLVEADIDIEGVPLDALVDPGGRYLIESYSLTSSPGLYYADSLRNDSDFSAIKHVLVVGSAAGAPDGETSLAPLPDALSEAQAVARTFPASRLLLGKDATLANIRSSLPGVQVFHFAGHAMTRSTHVGMLLTADQNRGGSTVLLDAATLGAMELDHLQLAVLSACATDSGKDGSPVDPDSLVRAFWRFGVPHVVASRWNVDSKATAATFAGFYRALLSGKSVAESLRVGADLVRARPETAHPYYWAAFSAFGRT